MTVYDKVFPLGLGTNRFPIGAMPTEEELESCVEMVLYALDCGVNYIDVAHNYSNGNTPEVLRRSFQRTNKPYYVTTKIVPMLKTADMVRKAVEGYLKSMGITRASHGMLWSIFTYSEFEECMKPGGVYDGMVKLKDEGIIDHIVFSTHANIDDIIKIINTQVFEGVTISYNLTNSISMEPVLASAVKNGIGVAAMNPLAGGLIPQNPDFFRYVCDSNEISIVQSALRYIAAQPAVNVTLAGPSTINELKECIKAFKLEKTEADKERVARVNNKMRSLNGFCTGCRYCEPCPVEIPISSIMQSRNTLLFNMEEGFNQTDKYVRENMQLFRRLIFELRVMPETSDNHCIRCGRCEDKCTQKLEICDAIDDFYKRVSFSNCSKAQMKDRLAYLLNGKNYNKVGFYPGGNHYASVVIDQYKEFFGDPTFEIVMFNSSPKIYGKYFGEYFIYSPDKIEEIRPDCILVDSYKYGNEIYENIKRLQEKGIAVVKLHEDNDVPWLF